MKLHQILFIGLISTGCFLKAEEHTGMTESSILNQSQQVEENDKQKLERQKEKTKRYKQALAEKTSKADELEKQLIQQQNRHFKTSNVAIVSAALVIGTPIVMWTVSFLIEAVKSRR